MKRELTLMVLLACFPAMGNTWPLAQQPRNI